MIERGGLSQKTWSSSIERHNGFMEMVSSGKYEGPYAKEEAWSLEGPLRVEESKGAIGTR